MAKGPEAIARVDRYRGAVAHFKTTIAPRARRQAWKQYVEELISRGSISAEEVRMHPRWRTPECGALSD